MRKLIGNRAFYRQLFTLMLPMMVQSGITNFVNMLDNVMIGAVGTAQMTGVSIANQLFFVMTLCIFGAVSGSGIFSAQYFGCGDYEGVRNTFRFKVLFCGGLTLIGIVIFLLFGESLLALYMRGEQGSVDVGETMHWAKNYMYIMLVGLLPFALVQCYTGTLREGSEPALPMKAGIVAVLVNLSLNYVLIFGKLGAPALGAAGAAIATVIARFTELIFIIFASRDPIRFPYLRGVYRTLRVPAVLAKKFFLKSLPLVCNEVLWAGGLALVNQCYSVYGLDVMAAGNISTTFWNLFAIAYLALGNAVGIILGKMLGANSLQEAREASVRMIATSFGVTVGVGVLYFICANFIPLLYNTEPEIRRLATALMQIAAIAMPFEAITHATYFTLRSGGKMFVTVMFDACFMWGANVLPAFLLSRYTAIGILPLYAIIQFVAVIKAAVGISMVRSGTWIKNLTDTEAKS